MNEPAVVLSDFALTALCLVFCWKLRASSARSRSLNANFIGIFAAIATAALLGGIVHGYLLEEGSIGRWAWIATLLTIGVSGYNLALVDLQLLSGERWLRTGRIVARVLLALYTLALVGITREFGIAIASYLPAALVLFGILLVRVLRDRGRFELFGLIGLSLTFVAAFVQQARIDLHPQYLDHRVLYHLIQGVGLWGLYRFGSDVSRRSDAAAWSEHRG